MKLGYMGPDGTFSHIAAIDHAKGAYELCGYPTIYSVIQSVINGETELGIVPIENSIEGSINTTLDALAYDDELFITAEYVLPIKQNILVKKGTSKDRITAIASHPSPFGQCGEFLKKHFPNARLMPMNSTVQAAIAARDGEFFRYNP